MTWLDAEADDAGNFFAVKVGELQPAVPELPQNARDVSLEYELLKTLGAHPNIVLAYALVANGDKFGMVMPVAVAALSKHLRDASVSEAVGWRWLWQAFNGVAHMHRHRVLHLDLKPGNMLLFPHSSGESSQSWRLTVTHVLNNKQLTAGSDNKKNKQQQHHHRHQQNKQQQQQQQQKQQLS